MHRRNVVLPEPDGPIIHTTSPRKISNDTPRRTWFFPNHFWTSLALRIDARVIATDFPSLISRVRVIFERRRCNRGHLILSLAGPRLRFFHWLRISAPAAP